MNPREVLESFPNLSALVIGDICLDRWCFYDPAEAEPSRETGIPRMGVVAAETTPGAGGTVANNLAAMGVGKVAVLGVVGDDGFGWELQRALSGRGIDASRLVSSSSVQTFTYTKLLNVMTQEEDRPRVDFVNTTPIEEPVERKLLDAVRESVHEFDLVVISDQAETARGGVVSAAMRQLISDLAVDQPGKIFVADSRERIELFRNVTIKPNQQEADAASKRLFGRVDYAALRCHTSSRLMVVTCGGEGVLLFTEAGEQRVPTPTVGNPVDICGAGDSFCAGFGAALAITKSPVAAARFGNLVASITIMKKGTGTASPQELLDAHSRG